MEPSTRSKIAEEARDATKYTAAMPVRFPALFSADPRLHGTHAAMLASLRALASESSEIGTGGTDSIGNEIPSSLESKGEDTGGAGVTAVPKHVAEESLTLRAEVTRLKNRYEPAHEKFRSQGVVKEGKKKTETEQCQPHSVLSEEDLATKESVLELAKEALAKAESGNEAAMAKARTLLGEKSGRSFIAQVHRRYDEKQDNAEGSGELDTELLVAYGEMRAAQAKLRQLEEEVLELKRCWNDPWRVAVRMERRCDKLKELVVAMGKEMVSEALRRGGGDGEMEGGGGGESKGEEEEGSGADRQQEDKDLCKLLGPHHTTKCYADHRQAQVKRWQEAVTKREAAAKEAKQHFNKLKEEVEGLVEEEMFESFQAAAATEDGASDARPLVRRLWSAREAVVAAERSHMEALKALELCDLGVPRVDELLVRLEALVDVLWRGYPGILANLLRSHDVETAMDKGSDRDREVVVSRVKAVVEGWLRGGEVPESFAGVRMRPKANTTGLEVDSKARQRSFVEAIR